MSIETDGAHGLHAAILKMSTAIVASIYRAWGSKGRASCGLQAHRERGGVCHAHEGTLVTCLNR